MPLRRRPLLATGSLTAAALVGLAAGLGGYTFVYAKGASYLGHASEPCANCHVMQQHYDAWSTSSHRAVAQCNDCHAPYALVPKYVVKARNGWNHAVAFTTGNFPEPIRITQPNREVTEGQCRECHQAIVDAIDPPHAHGADATGTGEGRMSCIRCHRNVGHPLY